MSRPPIVEAWIGFRFQPQADKEPWETLALAFVNDHVRAFPHVQVMRTEELRIEERTAAGVPRIISGKSKPNRIQARNSSGSRWIQLGEDLLVYNVVEKGEQYPGFETARTEALQMLDDYVLRFRPASVRQVALHYVDLIEIPFRQGGINLEDYFGLCLSVPDGFPVISRFSTMVEFAHSEQPDHLSLRFNSEPRRVDPSAFRFRMEWHMECENISSLDRSEISSRLDRARERIWQLFGLCFKDPTWQLFGRSGE